MKNKVKKILKQKKLLVKLRLPLFKMLLLKSKNWQLREKENLLNLLIWQLI